MIKNDNGQAFKCPKCDSSDIVKYGKALRKSGKVQRYACNNCYHIFLHPVISEGHTIAPRTVTEKETQWYKLLRYAGFLSHEAIALMNESFATPHMKGLIKERTRCLQKIVRGGGSENDYELSIHQAYVDNKWQSPGKTRGMEDDPSKMLEDAKKKFREKGK